jgi:predicted transcriptional regulator
VVDAGQGLTVDSALFHLSPYGANIIMKVKTSITLSAELIRQIDALASQYGTRSALIERAVRDFLAAQAKRTREAQDLEILNRRAEALNAEAEDVLSYQVEL